MFDEKQPEMYEEKQHEMFYEERAGAVTEHQVASYLAKVMGWMVVGLLTTVVVSLVCIAVPSILYALYNSNVIYGVFILQLLVVLFMSAAVGRVGPIAATVMFMAYAALTGVTFSSLFILFELTSLLYVFGITALMFAGLAVYGFVTRKDLTRAGSLALFGLFGIIVAGLANFLFRSTMLDLAVTVVGVIIFVVLIAYDTQKIKGMYLEATAAGYDDEHPELRKMAIYGALTLYLDFINLFLKLLRIFGRRRN